MDQTCGDRRLLGTMLVEQGAVKDDEVEVALRTQLETGEQLGEILVQRGLVCRPELVRALASQSGVELGEQRGSARVSGLRSSAGTAGATSESAWPSSAAYTPARRLTASGPPASRGVVDAPIRKGDAAA